MKTNQNSNLFAGLRSVLYGLLLAAATSPGWAQNTNPTNTFDVASSTTSFVTWWGPPSPIMTWDSTLDAGGDVNSGSARYEEAFTGTASEQFMTFFTIANRWGWDFGTILDASTYTNLSFDIRVDPSSGQRKNANDFGWLEIGLCTGTSPGTTPLPGRSIPLSAQGNWTHFDYPLNPTLANIDQVSGFFIKMWSNGDHTNSLIFNVDNFMLTKPTGTVVIPPPTVSLKQNTSGLNLVASGTGQYDRQQIRTVDSGFGWVGMTEPVTYEFNIKEGPGLGHNGFQAHLFLVPNSTDTAASIDWNAPNIFWLNVAGNGGAGGGQVTFMYKTNRPGGNDMLFNTDPAATRTNSLGEVSLIGAGSLGTITSTSILGTWKVTLGNDTNITVVTSDGTTANYSITADAAALFSGTVRAFFGAQPNDLANLGLGYVLDKARISTPSATLIEDNFAGGTLDTNKWAKQASDPVGVFVVPTDSPLSLIWTLPAAGFAPQITPSLTDGTPWVAASLGNPFKIQSNMRQLLSASELGNQDFFRLIKRTFTQLQVLLPGESPAPNTPTGKTGTPTPVDLNLTGGVMNVTVRAVDSTWNLISSATDLIHLTTTDGSAFTPPDARMVGGVATFTDFNAIYFGTPGSYTVTATNMSRDMPEATSSPVTVQ